MGIPIFYFICMLINPVSVTERAIHRGRHPEASNAVACQHRDGPEAGSGWNTLNAILYCVCFCALLYAFVYYVGIPGMDPKGYICFCFVFFCFCMTYFFIEINNRRANKHIKSK